MRQRCENENNRYYKYYGERGITVCERWAKFENFLADMGQPPSGHTLDRINNDGPYSPGNCRWSTRSAQQNNRRTNQHVTLDGVTRTVAEWSALTGVHRNTIDQRLAKGLPAREALNPEKRRDLSGLALGGRVSGDKRLARTHCKRGHPFDEANTYHDGKQRYCRACAREKEARRRQRAQCFR